MQGSAVYRPTKSDPTSVLHASSGGRHEGALLMRNARRLHPLLLSASNYNGHPHPPDQGVFYRIFLQPPCNQRHIATRQCFRRKVLPMSRCASVAPPHASCERHRPDCGAGRHFRGGGAGGCAHTGIVVTEAPVRRGAANRRRPLASPLSSSAASAAPAWDPTGPAVSLPHSRLAPGCALRRGPRYEILGERARSANAHAPGAP